MFTCIFVLASVCVYENMYDVYVWVYGHINVCPSLLIGWRKLLI